MTPFVLWVDDLQWSDASTLDWISAFAQRPEPARILLIGTFRPPETKGIEHPLDAVADCLMQRGCGREIALGGLDKAAIIHYLERRYPPALGQEQRFAQLAQVVQMRTAGNPLFMINVLAILSHVGCSFNRAEAGS